MFRRSTLDPADMRTYSPQLRAIIDASKEQMRRFSSEEEEWRNRFTYLQHRGYSLRRRFNPFLLPSWLLPGNENVDPSLFEDWIPSEARLNVIDARSAQGDLVYIKRVNSSSSELHIARHLRSIGRHPRNHCVPILDILEPETDGRECLSGLIARDPRDGPWKQSLVDTLMSEAYIVMPFLRNIDDPPFNTVTDVIDLVNQLLEGLSYMHSIGIAHRDCAYKNVMMDARKLYPDGFHPVLRTRDPTGQHPVHPLPREPGAVVYYYVDFGISTQVEPGQQRLVLGHDGLDQDVPELSLERPYDPFKVDIFILGNLFKTLLYNRFSNVSFLQPLCQSMMKREPSLRPTAAEAEQLWLSIRKDVSSIQQAWRLRSREEVWLQTAVLDAVSAGKFMVAWLVDRQG